MDWSSDVCSSDLENGDVVAQLQARLMAAGNDGPEAHAYSRPPEVEGEAANRAIMIADMAGVPLYGVHVSCVQAHEAIRRARTKGIRVYGEPLTQRAEGRAGGQEGVSKGRI